ncbi:hypothetical protein CVIRNUC_007929 [Coccomyxa viridis]|uniref:RING-CH-type domain-containing protein n=1 Tax=Coccomyxa viridis TaxID=1274662 RepID=A0AAV1IER2_9CHLO|nr:hypothetical protein CVIRNUC_007929 [Coccomyxa viridis]
MQSVRGKGRKLGPVVEGNAASGKEGSTSKISDLYTCRICFEEIKDASQLIAPCLCKGTHKYVHAKCLRRWQDTVQRRVQWKDKQDDRAYRCGVCRELYSAPPRLLQGRLNIAGSLKALALTSLVVLLALGLSGGPPWPQLAIVVLLIAGARGPSILCVAAIAMACILATLHAKGLRVVMRVDTAGRLGLAVIRHGAPVEGLQSGVLLAASDGLERSIFRRSVVLVYEHGNRSGARGVILSQPLGPTDPRFNPAATPGGLPALSHFLGGPVGMPGEGPLQEVAVIHTLAEVPGSRPLLQQNTTQDSAAELFEGGSLADVAAAASAASPQQPQHGRWGSARALRPAQQSGHPSVHVYHGICAWAEGQLEGELRSGSWGLTKAEVDDVLEVPPEQLWGRLMNQPNRLRWLRN